MASDQAATLALGQTQVRARQLEHGAVKLAGVDAERLAAWHTLRPQVDERAARQPDETRT